MIYPSFRDFLYVSMNRRTVPWSYHYSRTPISSIVYLNIGFQSVCNQRVVQFSSVALSHCSTGTSQHQEASLDPEPGLFSLAILTAVTMDTGMYILLRIYVQTPTKCAQISTCRWIKAWFIYSIIRLSGLPLELDNRGSTILVVS